jgi:hypothetical protein
MAMIAAFKPSDNVVCELCFARPAIGTFNVDDVETPVCAYDSTMRNEDNTQVIVPSHLH